MEFPVLINQVFIPDFDTIFALMYAWVALGTKVPKEFSEIILYPVLKHGAKLKDYRAST